LKLLGGNSVSEVTFTIREAIPSDAAQLITTMAKINQETSYVTVDEQGLAMTKAEMAVNLANLYESPNNVVLVALANEEIIGSASIKASSRFSVEHVGEIGLGILKDYWGYGLGTVLLEELIHWAQESKTIRRLELTVQVRNQRAIHIYQKCGFITEAVLKKGVKTTTGEVLTVQLMSLLIG
jgi:RimJ/RimL family protein N-acetyltransferase